MSDLIRREDVLRLAESGKLLSGSYGERAKDIIKGIPSAEPKVGKWIELNKNEDDTHNIQCTYCWQYVKSKGHANSFYTAKHFSYCPHCGAEMRTEF